MLLCVLKTASIASRKIIQFIIQKQDNALGFYLHYLHLNLVGQTKKRKHKKMIFFFGSAREAEQKEKMSFCG